MTAGPCRCLSRRLLAAWLLLPAGALPAAPGLAAPSLAPVAPKPTPSPALLRSLEGFARDLQRLDGTVSDQEPAAGPGAVPAADLPPDLAAPAPLALPADPQAVRIRRRLLISLPQAIDLALRNDPDLAERVAAVQEQGYRLAAIRGRFWPELAFQVGGSYGQLLSSATVWQDNAGLYPPGSPFLVRQGGWNQIQNNLLSGAASLRLDYELLSFERAAALGEVRFQRQQSQQAYAAQLRTLQLQVSEAYYGLQLADQLVRIRQAVLLNDQLVRDQVRALQQAGLVPRLDLMRADADLEQSRYRLQQATALQLSRERGLSNLVNVPFDVTLRAEQGVRLVAPWPLDLDTTLVRGLRDNPQLQTLQAARQALLRGADREAAALLPSLRLFVQAGLGQSVSTKPQVELQGCCSEAVIPQLEQQGRDWAAGAALRWRVFDGGVSASQAAAVRAAAQRTEQTLARQRNTVRQRLETAYLDHQAALGQILAARAAYRAAREAFRDVRARYQLGLASYTDVSSTIRTLTQALEARAEVITLANTSYAQLLRDLQPVPDQPSLPVLLPLELP